MNQHSLLQRWLGEGQKGIVQPQLGNIYKENMLSSAHFHQPVLKISREWQRQGLPGL